MLDISKFKVQDEYSTPAVAVELLLKYLKPKSNILCPFDKGNSQFVQVLIKSGHNVGYSHIDEPHNFCRVNENCLLHADFFEYTKQCIKKMKIDYIISNPPGSKKDKVLKRLYEFKVPFALLLPSYAVGGNKRYELFSENDLQLLIPKQRIHYISEAIVSDQPAMHSSFFCGNLLPRQLVFVNLENNSNT